MPKWTKLKPTRHQVAIAGSVQDALTGQAIQGADVKIAHAPEEFTRWLAMKAMQYRDRWQTMPNCPDRQYVALNSTFYLSRELKDKEGLELLTYTATDGHFYFVDLPNGIYTLAASLPSAGSRYSKTQVDNIQVSRDNSGTIQRAAVDIELPPTAIRGRVTEQISHSATDSQANSSSKLTPVVLARVQAEGSSVVTLSDREGNYLLTGLEVWKQLPEQSPRPIVSVSAQGYQPASQGISLNLGKVANLDFQLVRK